MSVAQLVEHDVTAQSEIRQDRFPVRWSGVTASLTQSPGSITTRAGALVLSADSRRGR